MYFPVSGVDTPIWLPSLVAFCISFFTSMGGISGAFLLLPFQMSVLGYTAPSVSATNQIFNIVAIPSGVYRYIREGRMLWPLAIILIAGTLPGVFLGVWIRIIYLPDPKYFKFFAGFVLLYIGIRLAESLVRKSKRGGAQKERSPREAGRRLEVEKVGFSIRRVAFTFKGETHSFSFPGLFLLCVVAGVVGGAYGIGGGSIIAPFLVAVVKLPVHAIAGAVLLGTFATSVFGVIAFHAMGLIYPQMQTAPDWLLGLAFGVGGLMGIYLGARCQKYVPSRVIETILCASILFVAAKYIFGAW